MSQQPDYMKMLNQYSDFTAGSEAELRRVVEPDDLIEVAAFYRLLQGLSGGLGMKRVIYCLPTIKGHQKGVTIGQAFAKAKVSEKRLFMVIRSEYPNDLIQLRRLLKMVEPTIDWPKLANVLYYWNKKNKQQILEDYFFYQHNPDNNPNAA